MPAPIVEPSPSEAAPGAGSVDGGTGRVTGRRGRGRRTTMADDEPVLFPVTEPAPAAPVDREAETPFAATMGAEPPDANLQPSAPSANAGDAALGREPRASKVAPLAFSRRRVPLISAVGLAGLLLAGLLLAGALAALQAGTGRPGPASVQSLPATPSAPAPTASPVVSASPIASPTPVPSPLALPTDQKRRRGN
jgi:hypothetical protein